MRFMFILAALLVHTTSSALAQGGSIRVDGDPAGKACNIVDATPGLITVYVVHDNANSVMGAQFRAAMPACMTASFISDQSVFSVTLGDSQTGVAIGYGSCQSGPVHILSINYLVSGLTPRCCRYPVTSDPRASNEIIVTDCSHREMTAVGGTTPVNSDGSCGCSDGLENATWGEIKETYKD
jgi:hypothetical protein